MDSPWQEQSPAELKNILRVVKPKQNDFAPPLILQKNSRIVCINLLATKINRTEITV